MQREKRRGRDYEKAAEGLLYPVNNRAKSDFGASSSCCLEIPQWEDCCFMAHKGSSVTSNVCSAPSASAPTSSLSQITALLQNLVYPSVWGIWIIYGKREGAWNMQAEQQQKTPVMVTTPLVEQGEAGMS